jgi:hypothetical protein
MDYITKNQSNRFHFSCLVNELILGHCWRYLFVFCPFPPQGGSVSFLNGLIFFKGAAFSRINLSPVTSAPIKLEFSNKLLNSISFFTVWLSRQPAVDRPLSQSAKSLVGSSVDSGTGIVSHPRRLDGADVLPVRTTRAPKAGLKFKSKHHHHFHLLVQISIAADKNWLD